MTDIHCFRLFHIYIYNLQVTQIDRPGGGTIDQPVVIAEAGMSRVKLGGTIQQGNKKGIFIYRMYLPSCTLVLRLACCMYDVDIDTLIATRA